MEPHTEFIRIYGRTFRLNVSQNHKGEVLIVAPHLSARLTHLLQTEILKRYPRYKICFGFGTDGWGNVVVFNAGEHSDEAVLVQAAQFQSVNVGI